MSKFIFKLTHKTTGNNAVVIADSVKEAKQLAATQGDSRRWFYTDVLTVAEVRNSLTNSVLALEN